jgi:hypothetical protein
MKKLVLIGDIVASQKIKDRNQIQKKINALFKTINSSDKYITSPFTITLGDEFQAVLQRADFIFKHCYEILYTVYPVKVRFSFGAGKITTAINTKQAIGMDGPAFYSARKGLEELKQNSFLFNLMCNDNSRIKLMKHSMFLLSHLSSGWKETRYKILTLLYDGFTAYEIAKRLKISDKAVYKNIDAGALLNIISLTKIISEEINSLLREK